MEERKQHQNKIIQLENPKIDNLDENKNYIDGWMKIMNYKREIHEIEEKQYRTQLSKKIFETRKNLDKQTIENEEKKNIEKILNDEHDKKILLDVEKFREEEAKKAQQNFLNREHEKLIRQSQIKDKKKEKRKNILNDIKIDKKMSIYK